MAKKSSLKAALNNQQSRLKKNAKVQEAAQKQNNTTKAKLKSKGKAKASPVHSIMPFRPEDKILLIGEGNFSFSSALFKHPALSYLPPCNVTATAYDSERECEEKYPEAKAIVEDLRARGVEVLFDVDATALEKCKALKGRKWDRVVWNFPHSGKGITDQDRNILSNQILILGFLRSAAPFLREGPVPTVVKRRKKKVGDDGSASEDETPQQDVSMSEDEDESPESAKSERSTGRGTILVTLRNVHPYTEWNLPKLAKKPPKPNNPSDRINPTYLQLRSFAFRRSEWPGYEHRMTKGERAHGTGKTGQGGEDRTWEFCLK